MNFFFFENFFTTFFIVSVDLSVNFFFFFNFIIMLICLYYTKQKKDNNNIKLYYFILILICFLNLMLFTTNNVYLYFFLYESIMLPSVLLTFLSSPNIRAKFISFYFLFWTQLGSFFFFVVTIYLFRNGVSKFTDTPVFNKQTFFILSFFLFFGFGIKIPVFPFHFWLTKTHVEVNTTFSIFLSGILVKIAIIGFYKFIFLFSINNFFYLSILLLGALDITIKLFFQVDYKKVIAYCTIFEMNLLTLIVFFSNYYNVNFLFLMCILHTIFSTIFFLINDFIYRRYNTRNIYSISSILNNSPILGYLIIISVLFFNGLPLTLKFNLELVFFLKLYNFNFFIFFFIFFIQIIFLVSFSKINLIILCNNCSFVKVNDLALYEFFLIIILFSFLLFL